MNGQFPPWNAQRRYSHMLACGSDTPQKYQGLDNDITSHCGEVTTDGNYKGRSRDVSHTIWPHRAQHKETDKRHVLSTVLSSSYSQGFSPDFEEIPSGMAEKSFSCYRVSQHPVGFNMGHIADGYGEGTNYLDIAASSTSASHLLVKEKDQELKRDSSSNWTSMIKEALEMSNGMDLEPDQSSRTSMVYGEIPREARGLEPVKDPFASVHHECPNVQEKCKTEVDHAPGSSVIFLSDATKIYPVKRNQDVQQRDSSLIDDPTMNDKVLKKTCRTLEQCSSFLCNPTKMHTLEQHMPAKNEVSGLITRSCLSHKFNPGKTNIDEQSKNVVDLASTVPSALSDIKRNREEGTLLPAAPQTATHHTKSYSNVSRRINVDREAKHREDYCPKGNNATLPSFHLPGRDNVDELVHCGFGGSEMKMKGTASENQKTGVSHNELILTERNWCQNPIKETRDDCHAQQLNSKHNFQTGMSNTDTQCFLNSTFAERSVCSSTSVRKLENLVHNCYKVIPPPPILTCTQLFHVQTDTTDEIEDECKDSNRQKGSIKAKRTQTKEAVSTPEKVCSAVFSSPKVVKKQKMLNQWDTTNHMEAQEASTFQDPADEPGYPTSDKVLSTKAINQSVDTDISSVFEKRDSIMEDLAQMSTKQDGSPMEKMDQSYIPEFPQIKKVHQNVLPVTSKNVLQNPDNVLNVQKMPQKRQTLDCEELTGQEQSKNFKSRKRGVYTSKTNLETLAFKKENLTEGVCPTTSVSQCTRKKLKKPEKCCGTPSSLFEEHQLVTSNVIRAPTTKQECGNISLIVNEDKHEEETEIKHQITAEDSFSEENMLKSSQSKRHERRSTMQTDSTIIATCNKSKFPYIVFSACTDSTLVTEDNTTTNTDEKKLNRAKKINNDASLDGATEVGDHCALQGNIQAKMMVPNMFSSKNGSPTRIVSQTVSEQEDCLPLVSVSDASGTVKTKTRARKAENKASNDITCNLEEKPYSCGVPKPLDSFSVTENSGLCLIPQITTKKFKKRKNSKNKVAPSSPIVFTDMLSSSHCISEEVNSNPDLQNSRSESSIRRDKSINATSITKVQNSLQDQVHPEVHDISDCCVQNTMKSANNLSIKGVSERANNMEDAFQPVPDVKTEPVEVKNYLKRLRQRKSTSKKDSFAFKSTELPITCENVSDLDKDSVSVKREPHKDCSSKPAKNDRKMDHLKSIKACVTRKRRAGRSFKKRKLMQLAKLLSAVHETSENTTAQDLQKMHQNDFPKDLIKMDLKTEKTQTEAFTDFSRISCHTRQNNSKSSMQTRFSISLVSHTCESPEHEPIIFSRPLCNTETVDSEEFTSNGNVCSSTAQKSHRRPIKKARKSARSEANAVQTDIKTAEKVNLDFVNQKIKSNMETGLYESRVAVKNDSQQKNSVAPMENDVPPIHMACPSTSAASAEDRVGAKAPTNILKRKSSRTFRQRTLLNIAVASGLENSQLGKKISSSSKVLNFKQGLIVHAKKRVKKPKMQLPSLSVLSLRHSRRLSKCSTGKASMPQKHDCNVAESKSLRRHSALSQETLRMDFMRQQMHNQKKGAQKNYRIKSLSKGNRDVTDSCNLTVTYEGKNQKVNEDSCRARSGRHLKLSEKNLKQVVTGILRRKRNFSSEKITKDEAIVIPTELDNRANAETQSNDTEMQEKSSFQKTHKSRPLCLLDKRRENANVNTDFKNKRKTTYQNTGQMSKRMSSSQDVDCLQQSTTDKLLNCFKDPLKTDTEGCISPNDCGADHSKILMTTEIKEVHFALSTNFSPESKNKDLKERKCKTKTRMRETKNEEALSTLQNGDAAFKYSKVNSSGDSCCDKKIKEETDLEILGRDVRVESSFANDGISSENLESQEVNVPKCDSDEDCMQRLIGGICVVEDPVKCKNVLTKTIAKKCIICKYCGQYFCHISAYTIHQRIHTGEKPYRCKICGKNFAQLSKLKFHQKVHLHQVALCCPCCSKTFSKKSSLLSHFKIHLQELKQKNKPNQDVQDKTLAPLSGPVKSTKNDRPLLCKTCESTFPNKFMLKIHMHMHEVDKPLSCKTCGREFQTSLHLLDHEKTHWPVKPYACSICGKGFTRLKALKKHSNEHTGETPFTCSHCGHSFRDLSELRVHQVSKLCIVKGKSHGENHNIEDFLVHQGVDGQVNTPVFFKCRICRQLYQKWCQYTLHLETHTKSPPYLCFACGQSYDRNSEVHVHCKLCCQSSGEEACCGASLSEIFHTDVTKQDSSKQISTLNRCSLQACKTENSSMSVQSESHNEEDAQATYRPVQKTENNIRQHSEVTEALSMPETVHQVTNIDLVPIHLHSSLPSPTPFAMSCAVSNDSLECIEISPSLWKFKCLHCGQQYRRYRSLLAHMQTHAPGFRHVCGCCGKSFDRRNRLWLHQRIHHVKGRWFSCSQCNIQFRFFGSYKEHLLNHVGDRSFACPLSPKAFVHAQHLCAYQYKLHQPSKVLQCDVCAKTFKNLRNLLKHSRLHSDAISHRCLSCQLAFTNNRILQEHLKIHNTSVDRLLPEVPTEPLAFPHKCKKCKATFSAGDLLYAHQICHFMGQVGSASVNESTSSELKGIPHPHTESPLPSTSKLLISTLNLNAIPNESLYTYPHPDKLYVVPCLSRRRLQIINLDSQDKQPASSPDTSANINVPGNERPGQRKSENAHLPQALESLEFSCVQSQPAENVSGPSTVTDFKDKASHNSVTQTDNFVETNVVLEDPTTSANTEENQELDESFECADCSYKTSRLMGLHEHYFLHALGNQYLDIN